MSPRKKSTCTRTPIVACVHYCIPGTTLYKDRFDSILMYKRSLHFGVELCTEIQGPFWFNFDIQTVHVFRMRALYRNTKTVLIQYWCSNDPYISDQSSVPKYEDRFDSILMYTSLYFGSKLCTEIQDRRFNIDAQIVFIFLQGLFWFNIDVQTVYKDRFDSILMYKCS